MQEKHALFIALLFFGMACSSTSKYICGDRIQFSDSRILELNSNELLLVCGDPSKQSWQDIPFSQSEYHLKTFIEARGYYQPKFQFKDNQLHVDPGPRLLVTSVDYFGAPEHFRDVRIRKILGQPLDTELLNYVDSSTVQRLKSMGYACPTLRVSAIKETGAVHVKIVPGPLYQFGKARGQAPGLHPDTLRRFDAFAPGDPFRYEWMKLTEERAENDGIVMNSQLTYKCPQEAANLELRHILIGGDKHLVAVGAGASSEEFPIAQISWKIVRMDENGSNGLITLYGSNRSQRLKATYFYFPSSLVPRLHLDPNVSLERRTEANFVSSELGLTTPISYQWDFSDSALRVSSGPSLRRSLFEKGTDTLSVTFISFVAHIGWFNHSYELYRNDPQAGSSVEFNIEFLRDTEFAMLGTLLGVTGVHLLKINSVFPAQWILGFRYGANTTFVPNAPSASERLPAQYLHALGGDQNIRGFGRNELYSTGTGVHTAAFGSVEVRYAKTLTFGIEPFAFFDFGALGEAPVSIDPRLYYSPGFGVRWQFPIGVVRATMAHGFLLPKTEDLINQEHFQLFLGFGQEF